MHMFTLCRETLIGKSWRQRKRVQIVQNIGEIKIIFGLPTASGLVKLTNLVLNILCWELKNNGNDLSALTDIDEQKMQENLNYVESCEFCKQIKMEQEWWRGSQQKCLHRPPPRSDPQPQIMAKTCFRDLVSIMQSSKSKTFKNWLVSKGKGWGKTNWVD